MTARGSVSPEYIAAARLKYPIVADHIDNQRQEITLLARRAESAERQVRDQSREIARLNDAIRELRHQRAAA